MLERFARTLARWRARSGDDLTPADRVLLGKYPGFDLVFADDARQNSPSRPGMRPVIAMGGISIPAYGARSLNEAIDRECSTRGFPEGEEFKWSPSRDSWMHKNLVAEERYEFFCAVLTLLADHDAQCTIVIVDGAAKCATGASTPDGDAVNLFLERVENSCRRHDTQCVVIADRPGGGRREEDAFLVHCIEMLVTGTQFVMPKCIAHNVLSTDSRLSRLLQAADLVTGCTLSRVSGERTYSPPLFEHIRQILVRDGDRIGGCGLKIHPTFRYLNLYHWLVGDSHYYRANVGVPLPRLGFIYADDEWTE